MHGYPKFPRTFHVLVEISKNISCLGGNFQEQRQNDVRMGKKLEILNWIELQACMIRKRSLEELVRKKKKICR